MTSVFYRWIAAAALVGTLSACVVTTPTETLTPSASPSSNLDNSSNASSSSGASGTQLGVPTEGLVDYLSFESAPDPEKTSNVSLTADRFGNANAAYNFSGEGSYVQVDFNLNPEVHPAVTLSAWVRYLPVTDDGYAGVAQVVSHDNGEYDRSIGIDNRSPSSTWGWTMFAGTQSVLGSAPLEAGQWAQLTAVYNQSTGEAALYVNGKPIAQSNEAVLGTGYDYLHIGGSPGFGEHFRGDIDDVRIYERALSASEASVLYELSKP